jgi:hypothetical protein
MSTEQALIVGGILGFILSGLLWVIIGVALGILQGGVEIAMKEKLNHDKKEQDASEKIS